MPPDKVECHQCGYEIDRDDAVGFAGEEHCCDMCAAQTVAEEFIGLEKHADDDTIRRAARILRAYADELDLILQHRRDARTQAYLMARAAR